MRRLHKTTESRRVVKLIGTVLAIVLATVSIAVFAPKMAVSAQAECPGDDDAPTPVEVSVTSVPIMVASTTSDYFVLYVSHDVDGTEVEIPVLVKRGSAGSTPLAENVEALPAERYRVEKYLIADPADVDGDCIDDITELGDLGNRSPVNRAVAIDINDGALAVPDNQTYDALAVGGYFKFGLIGIDTERPSVYFMNTKTHPTHQTFLDDRSINRQRVILGAIAYTQNLVAPDGSQGGYRYSLNTLPYRHSFSLMERTHTLLAASMPLLEDNLALYVRNRQLPDIQTDLPLYRESRINLLFDRDVYSGIDFLPLNPGEGVGRLQVLDPDDRPHPRDIVLYEALPNELPRVAGIISTVPQTPLSHVNLRAVQDGIPNAYIRDIRDDPAVAPLIGSYVRYEVAEDGYSVHAATKEEVDAHYEASRPQPQTPEQDLSVTEITPLNEIGFNDWRAFGVKAANVAVLGTLDFPEGTVPEGFAIPFHFYDEFMKHNNFYTRIETMLADEDFQTDFDVQDDTLDDLRDDIKDADTPQWIIDALTAMHAEFPAGQSLRYRSSTNNEDLPGFNGAGLYDSKTQDPEETAADGIDKSLKGVFASLWTFRAFTEREFHRIDHSAAMMGVLVHPNYKDELVNGVAVSFDPIYGWEETYYVNSQLGEDLVTNPVAHSVPEELLLGPVRGKYGPYTILGTSNQALPGQLLMTDAQLAQLRQHLEVIHDHFKELYNPGSGEPFAMEIEFKITSENVLAIKQARPWVFYSAGATNEAPVISSGSRTEFTYRENGTATVYTFRATDPERGAITWSVTGTDGDDFTIGETGVLRFANPPNYESPVDSGRDNVYEVTVVARDDAFSTGTLDAVVTVTDQDEGPEISGQQSLSFTENQATDRVLASYAATDPEDPGAAITRLSLTGSDAGDFTIDEDGELSFRYVPDYEQPADSGRDNVYNLSVRASDGSLYSYLPVTVTVEDVNEPPAVTGTTSFTYRENGTANLYTFRATDPERGNITWSLSGADDDFAISETGVLSFANPPNYESPNDSDRDNVYEVTVVAGDDAFNSGTLEITVTVTDQNEGPEVTGSVSLTFKENVEAERVLATYTARDPEDPFADITRWSLSGTDAGDFTIDENGELTFRNVPDHERPADSSRDNVYNFSVRASDGSVYGYLLVTVTVDDVNEAPTITTTSRTTFSHREKSGATIYTFRATDPEKSIISWSVAGADGNLFAIYKGIVTFKNFPDYENPGDSDRNNEYLLTVLARDDAFNTSSFPITVTMTNVNEGPEVTGSQTLTFTENQATDRVLATYTATDPEDPSAVITRWSLSGTDAGDFTINESGELSFRNVPDHERPADSGRDNVYNFSVRASDGSLYGYLPVTVTVEDVNEPPTITTTSRTEFSYRENGTTTIYTFKATDPEKSTITWSVTGADNNDFTISETGALTFTSPPNFEYPQGSGLDNNEYLVTVQARDDNFNTSSLDVVVTVTDVNEGPEVSGQQFLTFTENQATDRVLATYNATDPEDPSAVITRWSLSGTDAGDFTINESGELSFRNIPDYERPADSGRDNVYNFSVRASDGSLYGYLPVTVTVEDVNEPPTITTTSRTEFSYRENGTTTIYTFKATDPEKSTITWSVTGADNNDFTISETGALTFTSPPNFEYPQGSGLDNNEYLVTVQARDDNFNSSSLDVVVTVTDVNEGPEVSGTTSLSFTENQLTDRVLATYSGTDPEDPFADITRWSLSGTDAGDFTINESGELSFRNVPDYERPADSGRDNVYNFSVRASDGSLYGYLPVTVTVEDVNEPPTITTTSRTEFSYRENGTTTIYTFKATDPEKSTITWSVTGADNNDFTISETGALTFTSPPNFEYPQGSGLDNNEYLVTVQARDDNFNTSSLDVVVTVTDVNEGPEVSGTTSLSFTENQLTDRVLATYSGTDPEDPSADITRWSLSGTDAGDFTINESGELSFRNVPDYERPADSGRDNVYNFSVRASDGSLYGYLPVTVTVEDVNEPPTITTTSRTEFSYRENGTTTIYTFKATDPEKSTITWSVTGADNNDFTISETGALTFTSPPNFEYPQGSGLDNNEYLVTVQARDDNFNTSSLDVTVTVTDVNEGPEVSGQQFLTFTENQATDRVLATYNATDPEDPSAVITRWSLSGTDAGDFTINESGELSFRNVPDHERPADSGRDNVYNFSVRASDGSLYGYLSVTVTVDDVNEPPTITTTSRTEFSYRENGTTTIYTFKATDPEKSTITWSVTGADNNDFAISETGALTFTSPPNFEYPQGSGLDNNEYLVTVQARDDNFNTSSLDVTVTVTDVNEGPEVSGQQFLTFTENQATDRVLATYSGTDPEDPFADITRWSLSGTDAGDFTINENGELSFRNVPDHERPADSGRDNVYNFSVRASDGSLYGYLSVTVTVDDVNEPPTITTTSKTDFSYRENGTATIYTFKASDPERGTIEWSTAGADRDDFTISDTGALTFTDSPNFESPQGSGLDNNEYLVTIQARDDNFNTSSLPVTVTVTDVNEGPEISGTTGLTFTENVETERVLATYSGTDPEDPFADITRWSLSGTDAGDFTINESGELSFRNVPDHERPADSGRDNVYNFSVRASDGSLYGYLSVTVTVDDVNEPPTITTTSKTDFSYRENGTATIYTFKASDPERGTIEWSTAGADRDDFTISDTGALTFTDSPNFESPQGSGLDNNEYLVTIQARDDNFNTSSLPVTVTVTDVNEGPEISGTTGLTFTENVETERVLATYSGTDPEDPFADITRWSLSGTDAGDFTINENGELSFRNVPDHERPADSGRDNVYNFSVRASDGSLYGYLEVTVAVEDVNEAPTITTTSKTTFTYRENGTATIYTFKASDPERGTIEWSTAGADRDDFTISDTGALTFTDSPNFESPQGSGLDNNEYLVTIQARDDNFNTSSLPVTVTVTDVNEGPEVTGTTNLTFTENVGTDRVLATYTGRDPEDHFAGITRWSLSGTDAGDFTINESGQLSFRNVPNHERPADSNRDNVYNLSVRASDGSLYGYLEVTVAVEDVNEPPAITTTSKTSFTYTENGTATIYTFKATDPEQGTIFWSVTGTDGDDCTISETGVLSFASPPDFENPADSDGNNEYLVTVEARDDDFNRASLEVAIEVINLTD